MIEADYLILEISGEMYCLYDPVGVLLYGPGRIGDIEDYALELLGYVPKIINY